MLWQMARTESKRMSCFDATGTFEALHGSLETAEWPKCALPMTILSAFWIVYPRKRGKYLKWCDLQTLKCREITIFSWRTTLRSESPSEMMRSPFSEAFIRLLVGWTIAAFPIRAVNTMNDLESTKLWRCRTLWRGNRFVVAGDRGLQRRNQSVDTNCSRNTGYFVNANSVTLRRAVAMNRWTSCLECWGTSSSTWPQRSKVFFYFLLFF